MTNFFNQKGIIHQRSCVETPKKNCIVKRKHQHLLNVARVLFFQSSPSLCYWNDCILNAVNLINRSLTLLLKYKTPHKVLFYANPSYSHVKVFGCLCFVSTFSHDRKKFLSMREEMYFPGLPLWSKAL